MNFTVNEKFPREDFLDEIDTLSKEYESKLSNTKSRETPSTEQSSGHDSIARRFGIGPSESPTKEELTHAFHTGEEI